MFPGVGLPFLAYARLSLAQLLPPRRELIQKNVRGLFLHWARGARTAASAFTHRINAEAGARRLCEWPGQAVNGKQAPCEWKQEAGSSASQCWAFARLQARRPRGSRSTGFYVSFLRITQQQHFSHSFFSPPVNFRALPHYLHAQLILRFSVIKSSHAGPQSILLSAAPVDLGVAHSAGL